VTWGEDNRSQAAGGSVGSVVAVVAVGSVGSVVAVVAVGSVVAAVVLGTVIILAALIFMAYSWSQLAICKGLYQCPTP